MCLDLWGKQGGASLQSLHFSFAVGAFIAPILVQPFLSGAYPAALSVEHGTNVSTSRPTLLPALDDRRLKRDAGNSSSLGGVGRGETLVSTQNDSSFAVGRDSTKPHQNSFVGNVSAIQLPTTNASAPGNESRSPIPNNAQQGESPDRSGNNTVKVPKPKPSFTNANLLQEHSKWDRPPQKEPLKDPKKEEKPATTQVLSSAVSLTSPPSVNVSKTVVSAFTHNSSLDGHTTIANSSAAPKSDGGILKNITNKETISTPTNVSSTTKSSIENNYTTTIIGDSNSTTTTTISPYKTANDTVGLSFSIEPSQNSTSEIVNSSSVSFTMSTTTGISNAYVETDQTIVSSKHDILQKTATNKTFAAPSVEITSTPMFVIDFSNHSDDTDVDRFEEELYGDDFATDSFSDYPGITSAVERVIEEGQAPELLDLKEHPTQEDEDSTISVTASFPSGEVSSHQGHQSKPGTFSNVSDTNSRFFESLVNRFRNYGVTSIHFIYICIGVFLLLNAFVSVAIMCHNPREPRSKQEDVSSASLHRTRAKLFLGVFSFYMFMAEALQGAVHHLLASAHTENGLPTVGRNVDGAAIFWGLMCVTRFLCILISGCMRVRPSKILVVSTFLMVVGTIFICVGTFDKHDFLWGGIVVVAIGLAPVLPTCFLWMAELMRVTHRMCALMIVISSFGNSITHTSLAHITANSHLYAYILIGIGVCSLAFLSVSFYLLLRAQSSKSLAVPGGYQLANQEEEEAVELTRPTPNNFDTMSRRLSDMGEAGQALLID